MIEFMLLGAPRSGTTWAANWLTTDKTLCLHDPLAEYLPEELDTIEAPGRVLGVACTALALFPDFVNAHPARKVIVHRDQRGIDLSLARLGMPASYPVEQLDALDGMHVGWRDLFKRPRAIYEHLTGLPFDAQRHRTLVNYNVQSGIPRARPGHLEKICGALLRQ